MQQLLIELTLPGYYDFALYSDLPDNFGILEYSTSNYWEGCEQIQLENINVKTIQNEQRFIKTKIQKKHRC